MLSDPYRMVLIGVISFLLLACGIIFYSRIYPKKNIDPLVILILVSFLPVLTLLRPGSYESGDFNIHIYRIISFYDSLMEGNFMPSWAAELNSTFGNPLFIFNYALSYYMVSFFHFIGFSFVTSMKIFLSLSFIFSGVFMYFWIEKLTGNKFAAFTAGIFYLFNPYHLIDFSFRATLGELTVFTLAPLVFLYVTEYFKQKKPVFLVLISLVTTLLFLGHPLLSVAILGILFLYVFYLSRINKDRNSLFVIFPSLFIGIIASSYSWISFILYSPYTFPMPNKDLSFAPFYQLFYSPWRFGFLYQGHYGELALFIGYTQLFVILTAILILIKNKVPKSIRMHYLFWLSLFIFFLFIMSPFSKFIWKLFPIFWMFIPTGRLLLPTAFCTSVIAGYFAIAFSNSKAKRKFLYILLIITIISTILNWGHRKIIPGIRDDVLRKNVWSSTLAEGATAYFINSRWADINNFWFSQRPKEHMEIIEGKGIIKQLKRTSTEHFYVLDAQSPITLKENTLYFPGWSLRSNGNDVLISPGKRGVINAKLSEGLHYLEFKYEDLPLYKLSKTIGFSLFLIMLTLLLYYFLPWQIRKK